MTGGLLQVTLLVIITVSYLILVASGNCVTGNRLYQHTGRNAIPCNKTEWHVKKERKFMQRNIP